DIEDAAVVEVFFAFGRVGLERIDDLRFAAVNGLLVAGGGSGFRQWQIDQELVAAGTAETLNSGVVQADTVHFGPYRIGIRRVRVSHIHQGSATELDAPVDAVPKDHREHASDTETERKRDEVPLLAEKVDVRISKEFHAA